MLASPSLSRLLLVAGVSIAGVGPAGCGRIIDGIAEEIDPDEDEDEDAEEWSPCGGSLDVALRASLTRTPSGRTLHGVVVLGEQIVAVGAAGEIVTRDGEDPWFERNSHVTGDLYAVARAGGTTEVVAVGAGGTVLRSGNSGDGWTTVESGTTADLTAVTFLNDDVAIAVGDAVLRSVDRGSTWAPVAAPALTGTLRAVTAAPYLLAVGDGGLAIVSEDAGKTWAATDVGTPRDLFAVGSAPENELLLSTPQYFVVAGAAGTVRVAHGSWQDVADVDRADTFLALSFGGRWLVGSDGAIRVNVDDAPERVDFQEFESPTDEALRAIDGGFDWAVAVGTGGAVVTIEEVLVASDGTVCP